MHVMFRVNLDAIAAYLCDVQGQDHSHVAQVHPFAAEVTHIIQPSVLYL